jgi:2-desacetyl-2-hydroxyethyl bacteriochlorophyllide A dehydrogenase
MVKSSVKTNDLRSVITVRIVAAMGTQLTFARAQTVGFFDYEDVPISPSEVRVRTLFSGISTGTEMTAYRGTSPHLTKHWDAESRLFQDGGDAPAFPVEVVGYEEVGEIVETGADVADVAVGDRVWGTWGHRTTAVLDGAYASARRLSDTADPRVGIFSHIGAVALNAVLDADIHVGETVVVFGLGVPGQLAAQFARLNGARVVVVDGIAARRELAGRLGAEVVLDPTEDQVAERVRELTGGRGADVAIEFTGNHRALQTAIRTVAYNSRVCVAGFFVGEASGLALGEEFHHNRVQLVSSQISGSAPRLQHRWDRLRLNTTAINLAAKGTLDPLSLITHTIPFAEAAHAYQLIDERPADALQVVLEMPAAVAA